VDLKLPIEVSDELLDEVITANAMLDLASGEIYRLEYQDYDLEDEGPPWKRKDYEFSCGTLSNNGKDIEFTVQIDKATGAYSVNATELLEVKVRAAALFSGVPAGNMLKSMDAAAKPAAKKNPKQGGFILFAIPILLVLALVGYGFFVWKWAYSEGERAGFVQKLSKKGFVCKTWEGELSMVSMPGTSPEKFLFTIWDDQVAEQLNKAVGKRVALYYEEKVGLPGSCFGDTRYYVTKVKALE
jgi:nitrate reductase NapE component